MIAIIKTFKETYTDVRGHLLPWVRVAFTPFIIYLIGIIAMGIGFYLSGGMTYFIEHGAVIQNAEQTSASAEFFNLIYHVFYILAMTIWYLNGFRYAALGEGGNTWWNFPWNKRLWKMFLYHLLIIVLFIAYGGLAAGTTVVAYLLTENVFLAILIGTLFGLGLFYLIGRLTLVFLNVAIDKKEALRTSWHVMKGNVLRLIGLFILIWLAIIGITILGSAIIGLGGWILGLINMWLGVIIFALFVPFGLFVWLVSAALTMKAIALVNKQLTK